ncbi:hypothetical protein B0H11DRAFT_2228037 [Mycena galericulata]|nr:hypothetical protein B0H11DRAFT_2228037 [Mycena galericulata]
MVFSLSTSLTFAGAPRLTGWAMLPFDIRLLIFEMLLVHLPLELCSLYRLRAKLLALSPVLNAFMLDQPSFWRHIGISPSTPPEAIAAFISRSQYLAPYFYFKFGSSAGSSLRRVPIRARLASLSAHLARAERVHINCHDHIGSSLVQSAFSDVSCPNLRHLTIFYPLCRGEEEVPGRMDARIALPWFQNSFPCLVRLDLFGVSLRYADVYFPSLEFLRLRGLPDRFGLRHHTVSELIAHSPVLSSMCLTTALSSDFAELDDAQPISSLSLTTLNLRFSPDFAVAYFARCLSAPNITALFTDFGRLDLALDFAVCSQLMAQITSLTLIDPTLGAFISSGMMFIHLPSLSTLDLHGCTPDVFEQLLSVSSGHVVDGLTTVLPRLRAIDVNYVPADSLRSFVVLHGANNHSDGSHMVLAVVNVVWAVSSGYPGNNSQDVDWLTAHVACFQEHVPRVAN